MKRVVARSVLVALALAAAVYIGGVSYLYVFQRGFVFKPSGELANPADKDLLGVETVSLTMKDGTELRGWRSQSQAGMPVFLYFHGNAGTLSGRAERFRRIIDAGYGLLAFSYRGFAGSGGSPGEAEIFSDALEIFDRLNGEGERVVLFGESLGTGVAVYVAAEREAAALILEAPFTAATDIAADTYPWVPVTLLMRDQFRSLDRMAEVNEPLLIVHGTADAVVPFRYGRRLFDAAKEPKRFEAIDGATHSNLWDNGLWPAVVKFLADQRVTPAA
jgi:uncharacterized protein